MATVFIGIGSNLGDRKGNISKAIAFLKNIDDIIVDKVSLLMETQSQGVEGPAYLNGIIKLETDLPVRDLLKKLQSIEKTLGRIRSVKNAPRTIDLDMLLYSNETINEPELEIPHPRMFEREFVMKPLLEIEPNIMKLIDIMGAGKQRPYKIRQINIK